MTNEAPVEVSVPMTRRQKVGWSMIWGGALAVSAALGMLTKWTMDFEKEQAAQRQQTAAYAYVLNSLVNEAKVSRADINRLLRAQGKRARQAAIDSVRALEAEEGFPGVLPMLGRIFFGIKPKTAAKT